MIVGCGSCRLCRQKQANEWATRLLLESSLYDLHTQWTCLLTYDNEHLPENGSLVKTEMSQFFRRVRALYYKRYGRSVKFRYFVACEYGESRGRPHYHILFFGVPPSPSFIKCLNDCWQKGFIGPQMLRSRRGICNYIAAYVTKKGKASEFEEIEGRIAQFSTMSKTSGAIGYGAIKHRALQLNFCYQYEIKLGSVVVALPRALRRKYELEHLSGESYWSVQDMRIRIALASQVARAFRHSPDDIIAYIEEYGEIIDNIENEKAINFNALENIRQDSQISVKKLLERDRIYQRNKWSAYESLRKAA